MNDVTFQRKLLSVLKDNMYQRYVGRKRTGKLDTKKLYRVHTTNRVFKKPVELKGSQYSITVLVDLSGSMSGSKEESARKATIMLSRSLEKVRVPHQIYGFNSALIGLKSFQEKNLDEDLMKKMMMAQTHPRRMRINELPKKLRPTVTYIKKDDYLYGCDHPDFYQIYESGNFQRLERGAHGNFDGYFVQRVMDTVAGRKGTNIIIMLSDGKPAHDHGDFKVPSKGKKDKYYLADYPLEGIVHSAIQKGIVFVGIGINSNAVEKYYPPRNTAVVQDLKELYPSIISKLDNLVKRGV